MRIRESHEGTFWRVAVGSMAAVGILLVSAVVVYGQGLSLEEKRALVFLDGHELEAKASPPSLPIVGPVQATEATYTITHEPPYQEVAVGDTFEINVIYHANLADTTVFSRMAIKYDTLVVDLIAIENGADVPAGAYDAPFINWGPVWFNDGTTYIAEQVYLGQFWEPGCTDHPATIGTNRCEQWDGHAITYRFVAIGEGVARVEYAEYGHTMNYVDQAPWICYQRPSGEYYVAEYTSDQSALRACLNFLHLPNAMVVVGDPGVVGVEEKSWSHVKTLYKATRLLDLPKGEQ